VLNVGLLAYFPGKCRLAFLCPDKLIRLKFTYPNVPEKTIKLYFKAFEEKIGKLNATPELFAGLELDNAFEKFISKEFLSEDSSALQFGEIKKGVQYIDDYKLICNQLYNLYFSVFEHHISNYNRIDESHLLTKYKNLIKDLGRESYTKENKRLYFDYKISPKEGESFKFDIGWKNDTLNLVKPVSFDVARNETIQSKAYKYYGQFLDLEDFAAQNNIRFDLLIAKPKKKELFKTFDNAIALLNKPKRVELIEQEGLSDYSIKTVNALSLFDNA
jgi:hypothetical protein